MSNPCRIRYCTQEILIFRYNLLNKMRRHCIITPNLVSSNNLIYHLCHTIISQSCLLPLSNNICPIIWNYSDSLSLYPMPNLVILCDTHDEYELEMRNDCTIVCPGQFNTQGSFISYTPHDQTVDFSQLDCYQEQQEQQQEEYQQEQQGGRQGGGRQGRGKGKEREMKEKEDDGIDDSKLDASNSVNISKIRRNPQTILDDSIFQFDHDNSMMQNDDNDYGNDDDGNGNGDENILQSLDLDLSLDVDFNLKQT